MAFLDNLGGLLGGASIGTGPNKDINPMAQPVNNISELNNPNDTNQSQSINESYDSPPNLFGQHSTTFLDQQYERMGLDDMGINKEDFLKNIHEFSQNTRMMESDDNPYAANPESTAKGVYQFTDASVDTGKQRMLNMGYDTNFVGDIGADPRDWNDEQADAMFLSNIFAQSGSDDYLYRVGIGEPGAGREAYYKFHHTNPDEATRERTSEFFSPSPQDEVMDNYTSVDQAFNY
jgi:hypothetical protein